MCGFITSMDNQTAFVGIPCSWEPIRDNNSEGVPSQESLLLIAPLMAMANQEYSLVVGAALRSC